MNHWSQLTLTRREAVGPELACRLLRGWETERSSCLVHLSLPLRAWTRHLFGMPAGAACGEATFPNGVATFIDAYRAALDFGPA